METEFKVSASDTKATILQMLRGIPLNTSDFTDRYNLSMEYAKLNDKDRKVVEAVLEPNPKNELFLNATNDFAKIKISLRKMKEKKREDF